MISKLFRQLLPIQIVLASIAAVNGIISGIYGSNFIGADAMSAVGLYAPVNMIFTTLSTVLLGGTQVLCGRYLGQDRTDRTNDIFSLDMVIVAVLGVVIGVILFASASPIAALLGADEAAQAQLIPYLRGMSFGVLPLLATQQLSMFLSIERRTGRTAAGSVIYILINAILGYWFVGRMGMGAFGLSLSSSIGLWIFMIFLGQYYFTDKAMIRFSGSRLNTADFVDIFKVGYAGALSFGYQVIRGFAFNAIILRNIGNAGVASLATYTTINNLMWSIPAGIVAVGRLLLSVSYGEEDRDRLVETMRVVLHKYVPLYAAVCAVVALLAGPITHIFYQDTASDVYRMTLTSIRIVPVSMAFSIICVMFVYWGQISSKHELVHILSALDGVVCVVIFALIATPIVGMNGIWISYLFNGVVTTIVIVIYSWIKRRTVPHATGDLMVIPDDFGVTDDDRLDIYITDMDDVVRTSAAIQDFCEDRSIDDKRSHFAGLCMEEMAANIVSHGFTMDNREHIANVRVVHKGDDIILRIQDDCTAFDPQQRKDIKDPDDPTMNIGIRMTFAISKDISYQHMLGLNVLTIKI